MPCANSSQERRDGSFQKIVSQAFMEELPPEVKQALRRNVEELKKVQKWRHYADHARKGRTRKKYRNKLREYYKSRPASAFLGTHDLYWFPSSIVLTSGPGYSGGRGLNSGSPEAIWWLRRPEEFYPVGRGDCMRYWWPRVL